MNLGLRWSVLAFVLGSSSAWAGPTATLPEPGTFELLALGGVIVAAIAIRNRRRK
jgi:hypothetical protein